MWRMTAVALVSGVLAVSTAQAAEPAPAATPGTSPARPSIVPNLASQVTPLVPVPATPEQAQASRPVGQPVTVSLTLKPNEGREVKATMKAGEALVYRWHTDGAEVRFELHGEEFGAPADQ